MSNKLYFESKKESKVNQNMNIKTRSCYDVDNYYCHMKIVLKNLKDKINLAENPEIFILGVVTYVIHAL